jgi:NAD(P) transhydrogenase subunit beta
MMSKVRTAHIGNKINAIAIAGGIIATLIKKNIFPVWIIWPSMAIGLIIGLFLAKKTKIISMPQLVALFNGIGGAASAIVAAFAFIGIGANDGIFGKATSSLAISIGMATLTGSLIAAGKLHKIIDQKPIFLPWHNKLNIVLFVIIASIIAKLLFKSNSNDSIFITLLFLSASLYGIIFALRIGGGDMPITISLLNSLSGIAAAVAGFSISDILLVSVGGIVGASGLFLTRTMCEAMNRSLKSIVLGKTTTTDAKAIKFKVIDPTDIESKVKNEIKENIVPIMDNIGIDPIKTIKEARTVIIVPGYGMAVAQAQHLVYKLAERIKSNGAKVKFAIHPVAGRMPGHMDVLLIEAGIDFDDIFEMESINNEFAVTDLTIVVGANDVLNPAARSAMATPIYGMPILNVDQCGRVIIFNYDLKPGYSGVENPLYSRKKGIVVLQGDAKKTIEDILVNL